MKHVIRVLSHKGDVATEWTPGVKTEEKEAKQVFDRMLGQGYAMFSVSAPGKTGEQIRKFDPNAFEILATPQIRGG